MMKNKVIEIIKEDFHLFKHPAAAGLWLIITIVFSFALYDIINNYNTALNHIIEIEYKSYHNVKLDISKNKLKGNLNKYITTKQMTNQCYQENCGLPSIGEFNFYEVNFIKMNDDIFLYYSCFDKDNCVYNLPDKDIPKIKQQIITKAKENIKWDVIAMLAVLFGCYIDIRMRNVKIRNGYV